MKTFRLPLLVALLFLCGCHTQVQQWKPALDDHGVTYLYLSPFPKETGRIRFTVAALSAMRTDGAEIPLPLKLGEMKGSEMTRQRLLSSVPLPAGSYRGFSITATRAFLKGEDGDEAALHIPEEENRIDFPFEVRKGKALLVSLSLNYHESLKGMSFTPVFDASLPAKPLDNLTGYVTNFGADTVTVFDKKAAVAVGAIQTGRGPAGIVLDQVRRRAYVAASGDDIIEVIDVTAGSIINTIRLTPGDAPRDLALTPDGRTLISANTGSNTVSIIDPVDLLELEKINIPNQPGSVLIDRKGVRAYIFNVLAGSIQILDIPSRRLLGTVIRTDSAPLRGDFNRKNDRLIVYQQWSPSLLYIDQTTFLQQNRVNAGLGTSWVKVDTETDKLYVGKLEQRNVDVYDPFSLMPGEYLNSAGGVSHMTVDDEENNLLIVVPEKRMLQMVNLVSGDVKGEIDLDDNPYWATVVGER